MTNQPITCLVTRQTEEALTTMNELQALGFQCIIDSLWENQTHIDATDDLLERMNQKHLILIITSRNALRALIEFNSPTGHSMLIVGKNTTQFAQNHGFTEAHCVGETVEELFSTMLDQYDPKTHEFLYVRGQNISIELSDILAYHTFHINEIIVYHMIAANQLSNHTIHQLSDHTIQGLLLFSKRNAKLFISLVETHMLQECMLPIHVFCLSQSIANVIINSPLEFASISYPKTPSIEALMNRISDFKF